MWTAGTEVPVGRAHRAELTEHSSQSRAILGLDGYYCVFKTLARLLTLLISTKKFIVFDLGKSLNCANARLNATDLGMS
jgi:hypothetical protein